MLCKPSCLSFDFMHHSHSHITFPSLVVDTSSSPSSSPLPGSKFSSNKQVNVKTTTTPRRQTVWSGGGYDGDGAMYVHYILLLCAVLCWCPACLWLCSQFTWSHLWSTDTLINRDPRLVTSFHPPSCSLSNWFVCILCPSVFPMLYCAKDERQPAQMQTRLVCLVGCCTALVEYLFLLHSSLSYVGWNVIYLERCIWIRLWG